MKLPDINKKEKPKITGDPVVVDQSTHTEKKPNFFQKLIFGNTLNNKENKAEKPKKKKKEKIKYIASKESDVVEWNYEGNADITLGEEHISNTAKIILISLCVVIVCCIGVLIYMRHSIIDFISNPDIQLVSSEINLEVFSEFDPNSYIANSNKLDKLQEYNVDNPVDNQHLGDYTVTYYSRNRVNENVTTLTVHVVDTEAPEIILADTGDAANVKTITLLEGSEELLNLNPANYVLTMADNYDDRDHIELAYTPNELGELQINQVIADSGDAPNATMTIDYIATDTSGNSGTATLTIVIIKANGISEEDYQEMLERQAELEAQIEEQRHQLEEQQNQQQQQQPTTQQTAEPTYNAPSEIYVTVSSTEGRLSASAKIEAALRDAGYAVASTGDFTAGVIPGQNQDDMQPGQYDLAFPGMCTVYITVE